MSDGLRINRTLTIPSNELDLSFSPSGGPGGQHANRSSTRVDLAWNVDASQALGPRQRARIRSGLRNRIDSSGTLRLSSDSHRSQLRNREDVLRRLAALVAQALRPVKHRRKTSPTAASVERRLRAKRRRSEVKRARRPPGGDF
jgi:ribosome-associated protein